MARRQAAAAAQKVWPSSHKIVVGFVSPEDTLKFYPPGMEEKQTIFDLFRQVKIPAWIAESGSSEKRNINFLELLVFCKQAAPYFDDYVIENPSKLIEKLKADEILDSQEHTALIDELNKIIDTEVLCEDKRISKTHLRPYIKRWCEEDESKENYRFFNRAIIEDAYPNEIGINHHWLTRAARNGLRLPARSVLELWQLAHWAVNDKTFFKDKDNRAEQIARSMLRNAIAESQISSRLSRNLQTDIICTDGAGGTLLNFRELNLKVECVASIDTESSICIPPQSTIKSRIRIRRTKDSFPIFILKDKKKGTEEQLPRLVTAWLSILYDIYAFAPRLSVLTAAKIQPPIVGTCHAIVFFEDGKGMRHIEKELLWPAPQWELFRSHDLFWEYWKSFQSRSENKQQENKDLLPRILAAGWIRCVIDAFDTLNAHVYENISRRPETEIEFPAAPNEMDESEKKLIQRAACIYSSLAHDAELPLVKRQYYDGQAMRDWLLNELPVFFSDWYVPIKNQDNCLKKIITHLEKHDTNCKEHPNKKADPKKLVNDWRGNIKFIVAAMDEKIATLFEPEKCASDVRKTHKKYLEELCKNYKFHGF